MTPTQMFLVMLGSVVFLGIIFLGLPIYWSIRSSREKAKEQEGRH